MQLEGKYTVLDQGQNGMISDKVKETEDFDDDSL
jgi:hypothetical protein